MKTRTFRITGMSCDGCKRTVGKRIQGVPGVRSVSIDLKQGTADVEMEDQPGVEQAVVSAVNQTEIYQAVLI